MRVRVGVLAALLALPLAGAASTFGDATQDERVKIRTIGGFATLDPGASTLGCSAPAADIVKLSVGTAGNDAVMRMTLLDLGSEPRCRGQPLGSERVDYTYELENDRWTLRMRAGAACSGGWSCISLSRHGEGSFVEASTGGTGVVIGESWEVRMPMAGRTSAGQSYDIRGESFRVLASAEQVSAIGSLTFFDSVSAPTATLR